MALLGGEASTAQSSRPNNSSLTLRPKNAGRIEAPLQARRLAHAQSSYLPSFYSSEEELEILRRGLGIPDGRSYRMHQALATAGK